MLRKMQPVMLSLPLPLLLPESVRVRLAPAGALSLP